MKSKEVNHSYNYYKNKKLKKLILKKRLVIITATQLQNPNRRILTSIPNGSIFIDYIDTISSTKKKCNVKQRV